MGYRPEDTQPGEGHEGLSVCGAFRRHRAGGGWGVEMEDLGTTAAAERHRGSAPIPNPRQGQPNVIATAVTPTHCLDGPNQGDKTTQKLDCRKWRNQDPAQMSD